MPTGQPEQPGGGGAPVLVRKPGFNIKVPESIRKKHESARSSSPAKGIKPAKAAKQGGRRVAVDQSSIDAAAAEAAAAAMRAEAGHAASAAPPERSSPRRDGASEGDARRPSEPGSRGSRASGPSEGVTGRPSNGDGSRPADAGGEAGKRSAREERESGDSPRSRERKRPRDEGSSPYRVHGDAGRGHSEGQRDKEGTWREKDRRDDGRRRGSKDDDWRRDRGDGDGRRDRDNGGHRDRGDGGGRRGRDDDERRDRDDGDRRRDRDNVGRRSRDDNRHRDRDDGGRRDREDVDRRRDRDDGRRRDRDDDRHRDRDDDRRRERDDDRRRERDDDGRRGWNDDGRRERHDDGRRGRDDDGRRGRDDDGRHGRDDDNRRGRDDDGRRGRDDDGRRSRDDDNRRDRDDGGHRGRDDDNRRDRADEDKRRTHERDQRREVTRRDNERGGPTAVARPAPSTSLVRPGPAPGISGGPALAEGPPGSGLVSGTGSPTLSRPAPSRASPSGATRATPARAASPDRAQHPSDPLTHALDLLARSLGRTRWPRGGPGAEQRELLRNATEAADAPWVSSASWDRDDAAARALAASTPEASRASKAVRDTSSAPEAARRRAPLAPFTTAAIQGGAAWRAQLYGQQSERATGAVEAADIPASPVGTGDARERGPFYLSHRDPRTDPVLRARYEAERAWHARPSPVRWRGEAGDVGGAGTGDASSAKSWGSAPGDDLRDDAASAAPFESSGGGVGDGGLAAGGPPAVKRSGSEEGRVGGPLAAGKGAADGGTDGGDRTAPAPLPGGSRGPAPAARGLAQGEVPRPRTGAAGAPPALRLQPRAGLWRPVQATDGSLGAPRPLSELESAVTGGVLPRGTPAFREADRAWRSLGLNDGEAEGAAGARGGGRAQLGAEAGRAGPSVWEEAGGPSPARAEPPAPSGAGARDADVASPPPVAPAGAVTAAALGGWLRAEAELAGAVLGARREAVERALPRAADGRLAVAAGAAPLGPLAHASAPDAAWFKSASSEAAAALRARDRRLELALRRCTVDRGAAAGPQHPFVPLPRPHPGGVLAALRARLLHDISAPATTADQLLRAAIGRALGGGGPAEP